MCRILFAVGDGREMAPLVDALVKSSKRDPYKERRGRGSQHRDGWGYVLLREGSVRHYRTARPIFEDLRAVESLKDELNGFTVLMAHSRAASQGVKGLFNVQPLAFSSRHGFTFWLIHNGDLDKERIIEMAELEARELEGASDTYVFATYLCRRLQSPNLSDLLVQYRAIEETVRSVFNTAALFYDSRLGFRAFITARMSEGYLKDPLHRDYARLLVLERGNIFAVASSTLELYHPEEYREVPNETAFYLKIDGEGFEVKSLHL
ncbi:class II glutamine amidotransferase [Thermococcus sp. M36]|uniref:class II glutamine amidotransferase n=1 Tax=Thermococcus sp. M36 TaxID=1638261 RepID=UPI00143BB495|nr:class II glutamine amidotransferase [Thermococcus sp. M36]NJE04574.1 class II glutamine amidotransferase [Thermococcus sp. M36]